MTAKYSSRNLSPFIFSIYNRYYIGAFFGLAFLAALVDSGSWRDFPSDNNPVIRLVYPLAVIYFFWSGIDTFVWIIRRPNDFLEIVKRSNRKKRGWLAQNPSKIWFYYFYAIFMLILGVIELFGIIAMSLN